MYVTTESPHTQDGNPLSHELAVRCSGCNQRELCWSQDMTQEDVQRVDGLVATRKRLRKGESLQRTGEAFKSLYAVRSGSFKVCMTTDDGCEQVTGFKMSGETIGIDGIDTSFHMLDAIALEDSEVCAIPFARFEKATREVAGLQRHFYRLMSREIVADQNAMVLLGSMHAEQRVATFLLDLSRRFQTRGYSPAEFHLRMTREEIGSYLGLKLETVSRIMSRFHEAGLIQIKQKHVVIVDADALREAASPVTACL